MRRLALFALCLGGCIHPPEGLAHASARLVSLQVVSPATTPQGQLLLTARYQIDGLPLGAWKGASALLTVSLDDVPFASVVALPVMEPGDGVRVPLALGFSSVPLAAAGPWSSGQPVRVRLRGEITLRAGPDQAMRIATDVEALQVLPAQVLPPVRG